MGVNMENEGLPNFISIIIGAVIVGVIVFAGILIHAILTMPAGG
jgi:hypothetical protein